MIPLVQKKRTPSTDHWTILVRGDVLSIQRERDTLRSLSDLQLECIYFGRDLIAHQEPGLRIWTCFLGFLSLPFLDVLGKQYDDSWFYIPFGPLDSSPWLKTILTPRTSCCRTEHGWIVPGTSLRERVDEIRSDF